MDLVDRYLLAVRGQLPERLRADVTAELRDNLLSQVEEREAALGRPLTAVETEAQLRAFGHPLLVAARYRRVQHLIGPEVFPFYLFGLKVLLGVVAIVQVIGGAVFVALADDPWRTAEQVVDALFTALWATLVTVTVLAVTVELAGAGRYLTRWRVQDLPHARSKPYKSRSTLVSEIVFAILFLGWLVGLPSPWPTPTAEAGLQLSLTPIWDAVHWPVIVVVAASAVFNGVTLVRPDLDRLTAGLHLAGHLAALAILAVLLRAGRWVEVTATPEAVERLEAVSRATNVAVGVTLLCGAIAYAWEAVAYARRLAPRHEEGAFKPGTGASA